MHWKGPQRLKGLTVKVACLFHHQDVRTESGGWAGNKGGEMLVDPPSQHVLERTSCQIDGAGAMPASRRCLGPCRRTWVWGR